MVLILDWRKQMTVVHSWKRLTFNDLVILFFFLIFLRCVDSDIPFLGSY